MKAVAVESGMIALRREVVTIIIFVIIFIATITKTTSLQQQ